jgi:hypothetical protein
MGLLAEILESGDALAVRPATRQIRPPVDPMIDWTGEMKIFGDQGLDRSPILVDIGLVAA